MVLEAIKGKLNTNPEDSAISDEGIIPGSEYRDVLCEVKQAIELGGYNPVSQIMGFLLSDDLTHIANYGNARNLISKIDRDTLLEDMIRIYLEKNNNENN